MSFAVYTRLSVEIGGVRLSYNLSSFQLFIIKISNLPINSKSSIVSFLFPPHRFNNLIKLNFVCEVQYFTVSRGDTSFCMQLKGLCNNMTPERALMWSQCVRQTPLRFPTFTASFLQFTSSNITPEFTTACLCVFTIYQTVIFQQF